MFYRTCNSTVVECERVPFRFLINAHKSCKGSTKVMNIFVDGQRLATETFKMNGHWNQGHKDQWLVRAHSFTATRPKTTIAFESVTQSCGCMLLDDMRVVPAVSSWWQPSPKAPQGGGHRRFLQNASPGSYFGSTVAAPAKCPWDIFDDRVWELDKICCSDHSVCKAGKPPSICSPLCALALRGFVNDCKPILQLQTNGHILLDFEQKCLATGTVNVPLFIDAISTVSFNSHSNPVYQSTEIRF